MFTVIGAYAADHPDYRTKGGAPWLALAGGDTPGDAAENARVSMSGCEMGPDGRPTISDDEWQARMDNTTIIAVLENASAVYSDAINGDWEVLPVRDFTVDA